VQQFSKTLRIYFLFDAWLCSYTPPPPETLAVVKMQPESSFSAGASLQLHNDDKEEKVPGSGRAKVIGPLTSKHRRELGNPVKRYVA
jgi:hypothetical protein